MTRTATSRGLKPPRPFLKWVGGKNQLLPELMKRIDRLGDFDRYHEPFVGGGALYFELLRVKPQRKHAWLSDSNERLIETYRGVSDHVETVIRHLKQHTKNHSKKYYYKIREEIPRSPAQRAARIIYLNKTCFNGLFRENRKGEFNTPIGSYKNPTICDKANLHAVSKALQKAKIESRHFDTVVKKAKPGDLVYFDPPYHPVSSTSSFTAYDRGGFTEDSQRLLADKFRELDEKGVKVLLSNSMTDFIRDLYKGFKIDTVRANRAINSRADRRGKVDEALIRNF